jgi:hypothetical protein
LWPAVAGVTAVGLLVVSLALWTPALRKGDRPDTASTRALDVVSEETTVVEPQDDNVVLWWLDSRTPVYFVMQEERRTK